jgi:cardiolipin synthase
VPLNRFSPPFAPPMPRFEITAFVADEDFASEAEKMFLDDFALSREVQPGDYSDRSFWFKLAVRLSRLTAPVL